MHNEHLFQLDLDSLTKQQVLQRLWYRWMSHSDPSYDWVYDTYGGNVTLEVEYVFNNYRDDQDCLFMIGYMANVVEWVFVDYFKLDVSQIESLGRDMMLTASLDTGNPLYKALVSRGSEAYSELASQALTNLVKFVPINDDDVVDYFERMIRYYLKS